MESFHRCINEALRARLREPNWIDELSWVRLGIRTADNEDVNTSSVELIYGMPLTVPGDFIPQSSTSERTEVDRRKILAQLMGNLSTFSSIPPATRKFASSNIPVNIIEAD